MILKIREYLEYQFSSGEYLIAKSDLKNKFAGYSSRDISLALHSSKKYEIKKYCDYFLFLPKVDGKFYYHYFLDDLMKNLNLEYHICLESALDLLRGGDSFKQTKILVKIKKHKERWLDLHFDNKHIDFIGDKDFKVKTQIIKINNKKLIVSTPEQTLIDIFKYSKYTDPYTNKVELANKIIKLVDMQKLEELITDCLCQHHIRLLMYFLEESSCDIKHLLYKYDKESKKPPYSMRNYLPLDYSVTSNANKHKGLRLYLP